MMKKIIYLCLFMALIFNPVLAVAEGDTDFNRSDENDDFSDTVAELEKLQVDQERKEDEAAGKEGPSNTEEVTEILESESTYDE